MLNNLDHTEHMEEDEPSSSESSLPHWVQLEYSQMLSLAGPSSAVYFTNLSRSSALHLDTALIQAHDAGNSGDSRAKHVAETRGAMELRETHGIPLEEICLLDPKATQELRPEDGDGRFRWFLFGVRQYLDSLLYRRIKSKYRAY